ncbi:hypothetical protein H1C71_033187, partial [Ictidomys tridecemlineatus]
PSSRQLPSPPLCHPSALEECTPRHPAAAIPPRDSVDSAKPPAQPPEPTRHSFILRAHRGCQALAAQQQMGQCDSVELKFQQRERKGERTAGAINCTGACSGMQSSAAPP